MKINVEGAILLAIQAHHGQTDKAGLPYILHPLRVMGHFVDPADDDARTVAVLHDVIEDTWVGYDALKHYPPAVIGALDALTKRDGEDYEAYIQRVGRNPLASRVKLADIADNLNPHRKTPLEIANPLWKRYIKARAYLQDIQLTQEPQP